MKKLYLIILIISLSFPQERSTIFNTGSPDDLTTGYLIDENHSIANRFTAFNNYVLEAMVFYMSLQSTEGSVIVSIREDDGGVPGELVSELSEWNFQLNPLNPSGYNLIVTTDLCIYLDAGNHYWWTIHSADSITSATWIYSNNSAFTIAQSQDNGANWSTGSGHAGAGGIWAEQVYEASINQGDINGDFVVNVIDIVTLVGYILGDIGLTDEQTYLADVNHDGMIDVIDIVQLVNIILEVPEQSPDFTLEDINPASEYFSENIGPSFFSGQVSCYYFGKQG